MSALDDFRAQREFKKNPPTVMPGMESSGSGDNMTFPGASSPFSQPVRTARTYEYTKPDGKPFRESITKPDG